MLTQPAVAGVVVLYNSSASVIECVQTYLPQLNRLYVVDNSEPVNDSLVASLCALPNVRYLGNGGNQGVASALNCAARQALQEGFSYLLTMDDDTLVPTNLVSELLEVYKTHPDEKIGIVSAWHYPKPNKNPSLRRVLFTMTSGNLLNLSAYRTVGPFLDELFIDHIDHEYGLRLNKAGFSVLERPDSWLQHSLGEQKNIPFWPFHHRKFTSHQPIRTYYFVRNGIYLMKTYGSIHPHFFLIILRLLLKEIIKLFFFEDSRQIRLRFLHEAIRDVRGNRLGQWKPTSDFSLSTHTSETISEAGSSILNDVWAVIVVYKVALSNSNSYQTLKEAVRTFLSASTGLSNRGMRLNVLICDNSPTSQFDSYQAAPGDPFNIYYLHDPSNPGVSRSYNRAAELAGVHGMKKLLILDQDTRLPANLFQQYSVALTLYPNFPVYAPMLQEGSTLISPCRYFLRKGSLLNKIHPGIHEMTNRNVLNSGLLVDLEAFRQANGYNENIWLYFSDFVFFDRLKQHYKKFIVVDCQLQHELASSDYRNQEFALTRFAYYCQGARAACRNSLPAYLMYAVAVGLRSLLMGYRLRTTKFLKTFFRDFLAHQPF